MLLLALRAYRADLAMARRCARYPELVSLWRKAAASWATLAAQELGIMSKYPVPQPAYARKAQYYRRQARRLGR